MVNVNRFLQKTRYDFDDFVEIIRILRAPGGCPWDREQTHSSLRKSFIEETYEAIETIDNNDAVGMREELGDVMLQVMMHASIEEENGTFDIGAVINDICKKLVYRHPHVFGDVSATTSDEVLKNWDALKKTEKHQESDTEVLQSVSRALPALMRAQKVQHKASKAGMDFQDFVSAKKRLEEEIQELSLAVDCSGNTEEEYGDVLFSAVNLSRFIKVESEEALTKATDKFICRFARVEELAKREGKSMKELSFQEMDKLWNEAKNVINSATN